jgi:hypothetical protein
VLTCQLFLVISLWSHFSRTSGMPSAATRSSLWPDFNHSSFSIHKCVYNPYIFPCSQPRHLCSLIEKIPIISLRSHFSRSPHVRSAAATSDHTLWSDFSCSSFSTNKYVGNAYTHPCSVLRHLCSLVNNSWSYLFGLTSVAHPVCTRQQLPVIPFGLTSVAHLSAHTSMQGMHIYPH